MARFKKHVGLIGCGRDEQLPRRAMVRAPLSRGASTACLCLCRDTEAALEPVDNTEDSGALNSPHPDPWASPRGLLPDVVSCCRDPSGGNPRGDHVARCPLTSSRDGAKTVGRRLRHLSDCMAGRTHKWKKRQETPSPDWLADFVRTFVCSVLEWWQRPT